MRHRPTGPACGNNPNHPITDGDRQAVEDFKAYLEQRGDGRGDIVRYRKRPVEVATIRWTGDNEQAVQAFTGGPSTFYALDDAARENSDDPEATATVYDKLHSTWILVYTGQHIVRGVKGEYYPIAEDVLAETYERADAVSAAVAPPTQAASSLRAGLRDEIVKALGRITTVPPVAHRREQADHVLAVLYREWPWLRAEAEDAEPTDRTALREQAEAILRVVETALGDTLTDDARAEALAGITALLPEPAPTTDAPAAAPSAAVHKALRRWAYAAGHNEQGMGAAARRMYELVERDVLRRLADEPDNTQTTTESCAHCGQPVRRITGTLAAWWVHDPGGNTVCDWARPAHSTRATPKTDEARQDEVWPVKEATHRYAESLRAAPGQASADGHTGWECDAGAQLLISATTPGPGALGTHHGTIYACPVHQGAALQRIIGAGYQADPQPAPPGHRWNPWPCGHVTAHDAQALTALTAAEAQRDGVQP
ncbi:hypothetical protein [Streptomyces sp. PAM3C]|uniref:hypothetical protein n=1 Tax=Streptomyces sp. PAM3C TaxID=2847300 RepID=UPI001C1E318E|nr:hypothetical protein [Streptomyces sp. PAM3C]MBU5946765.1 hypothetical protein [Streptomyces sp. PAM3C]